jgi:biofilm PGA synthesis N-glycosyltransferase PgaC
MGVFLAISLVYLIYCMKILGFLRSWKRIAVSDSVGLQAVSVIIPFRNEGKSLNRLVKGLAQQEHPDFELVFVDDHSEDNGVDVLLQALKSTSVNFRLYQLKETEGKKAALSKGISEARNSIILTTDADCYMNKDWISVMTGPFNEEKVQMVAGPVSFIKNSFLARWQSIEFQALITIGAAGLSRARPTMANGANLSFRKSAFDDVNGYNNLPDTPSGDDEFLLAKISKRWPDSIRFQKSPMALVVTEAPKDWSAIISQKARWASKWRKGGRQSTQCLAVLTGLIQMAQLLMLCSLFWFTSFWWWAMVLLALRMIVEFALVTISAKDIGASRPSIGLFVLSFIIYPFYAIYIALVANFSTFDWKGRRYG